MVLFKPMPEEYARVVEHIRCTKRGITEAGIRAIPREYFRRLMRHLMPAPTIIMLQMRDVFLVFGQMLAPNWAANIPKQGRFLT